MADQRAGSRVHCRPIDHNAHAIRLRCEYLGRKKAQEQSSESQEVSPIGPKSVRLRHSVNHRDWPESVWPAARSLPAEAKVPHRGRLRHGRPALQPRYRSRVTAAAFTLHIRHTVNHSSEPAKCPPSRTININVPSGTVPRRRRRTRNCRSGRSRPRCVRPANRTGRARPRARSRAQGSSCHGDEKPGFDQLRHVRRRI